MGKELSPLSITGSLSVSRWPQQFFQIKTNRKLATGLRSFPPLPPAKFLPAAEEFLGQLSMSRHENRAGIETVTARQ